MYLKQHQWKPSQSKTSIKFKQTLTKGECIPWNTSLYTIMWTDNCNHNIWKHHNKKKVNVLHKISCKSKYVISLLDCWRARNSFCHNIEQPQKGYQKSSRCRSMQILITGSMSSISMENSQ